MWFWWFMLVCDLLIPVLMIMFGKVMWKHPPGKINGMIGYRDTFYEKYGHMEICTQLLRTPMVENRMGDTDSILFAAYSILLYFR